MKMPNSVTLKLLISLFSLAAITSGSSAFAQSNEIEMTQRTAESQIRHLIQPVLDKYCHDECKLLGINVSVDVAIDDEIAPGFDDVDRKPAGTLAPTQAKIKLLMNEKIGQVSKRQLLELLQQYLDTMEFPVKIDTISARFPEPIESSSKVAELRERITKQFRSTVEDLFHQFCPDHCLLTDYNLQTDVVNAEEAQFGTAGEYVQEGDVAIRIKDLAGTILIDTSLSPTEQENILTMAKLKTNFFKNVTLTSKALKFPHPSPEMNQIANQQYGIPLRSPAEIAADKSEKSDNRSDSKSTEVKSNESKNETENKENLTNNSVTNSKESNLKQERFERIEKIERVESGDAVQAELQKFKFYGLIFGCSILSLLIFITMASYRPRSGSSAGSTVHRVIQSLAADPTSASAPSTYRGGPESSSKDGDRNALIALRFEIERIVEELTMIFSQQPKVAKYVFSKVLTEEGVETTAQYIHIFGEGIVVDMLRDPSLQSDISELMEYYAKNPVTLTDEEKIDLVRKLHNRTIAGKLFVLGNRSSNLFDFLSEMDSLQILELIRTESLTVKAIVLTQCDPQKRASVYANFEEDVRMRLLSELSRIDHLPRAFIFNVSNALKRKRLENPKLNTEALPGSEVLVTLLERTSSEMQKTVVKSLESTNPESARTVMSKLVCVDTLRFLRDGQLLEVILSLKHDELLQFLKGAPADIRSAIFAKSPKELITELEEELQTMSVISRETYLGVERKVLNRMKMMSNEGLINLVETNERMFAAGGAGKPFVEAGPDQSGKGSSSSGQRAA